MAKDADNGDTKLSPKRIKAANLNIRLSEDTLEWLGEVAAKQEMGASTLARMWLLKRLSEEGAPSWGEWSRPAGEPGRDTKRSVAEPAGRGIRVAKSKSVRGR